MKKIVIVFICFIAFCGLAFCLAFNIYQLTPHRITDVEEIKELCSEFGDLPIDSCDCYWEADIMFMGGAKESHSSGKLILSESFYNMLLESYDWIESTGMPNVNPVFIEQMKTKASPIFKDFIDGKYLESKEFQDEYYSVVLLSKDEPAIYFFNSNF